MPAPNPLSLVAEVSYHCPLHCPYCSNPMDIGGDRYRDELDTDEWTRVLAEAGRLGVLQVGFSGGEPLVRRDLEQLVAAARGAGIYSTLVTAGTLLTRERAERLRAAGLDHVQVSIQDAVAEGSDLISGTRSFERKLGAARTAKELGYPLTLNFVLHRVNLDHVGEMLELAETLEADSVELANTQYYGWAVANQEALLPTWAQLERAEQLVQEFRARGTGIDVIWVLPDFYEELPKRCMGGWGQTTMVIAPNGDVLPCQAATDIPELEFASVRERPLDWIWFESDAFNRFRGTDWMQEPCRSCPLSRQETDLGGCRCQALRLTGDARATDPVCHLSPHHGVVVAAREAAETPGKPALVYRSMRRGAHVVT